MNRTSALKLVLAIVLCGLAGFIGSIFTSSAIPTWYQTLIKPSFNPPAWIFGPVWTALYLMMGISLFLVWNNGWREPKVRRSTRIFVLQLTLNALWSVIFFGLHSPLWAFVDLIALWLSVAWTIASFWNISKASSYLLLPYLLWISFAGVLNYSIWVLN